VGDHRVIGVVLNWNGAADTRRAVTSLLDGGGVDGVVVVDNGSAAADATALARDCKGDARIDLVSLPRNLGFAGGVNEGCRRAFAAGAWAVLLLNSDAVLEPGGALALRRGVEASPDVGAAGPRILLDDGSRIAWFAGGRMAPLFGQAVPEGAGRRERDLTDVERRTDFLTFCCVLVTRAAWERAGPLDEEFFAYYEDADWCRRARVAGLQLVHCPSAVALHGVGGTTGPGTALHAYLLARGRVLFVKRHVGTWARRLVFWPWMMLVRFPHDALKYLFTRGPAPAAACLRGLLDGNRGGPPRRFRVALGLDGGTP
jgi:GT2 family glycosyltransferase